MRIRFVHEGTLSAFKENYRPSEEKTLHLIVFGFNGAGEISYERELKGESDFFEKTALLSKTANAVVISGCVTNTCGRKRRSAVVSQQGRLLGVSDTLHAVDGEYDSGAGLRVYETKLGKIGVVVSEDIYFPETVKALSLCGSELIVCPFGKTRDELQSVLLRASAYYYGVPILFCGVGYSMIAQTDGTLAFASPLSPVDVDFENKKEYHLVETRKRGCFVADMSNTF